MTPEKQSLLAQLTKICALSPEVRFGQLLANIGLLTEDQTGKSLWDVDDDTLSQILAAHRADLEAVSSTEVQAGTAGPT